MTMMPDERRKSARNCPECGQPMTPWNDGGMEHLGCSAWPECRHTEPLPEDVLMRRQNTRTLPGF